MEEVRVALGDRSYSIVIGSGNLGDIGSQIVNFDFSRKIAIVSNPTVYDLYGKRVKESIQKAGFEVYDVIIPDGEQYKDFQWAYTILTELLQKKLDRRSAIVALGGGVIGDIAAFAASLYMRGIACIQIPTTLLSQVDSSVGGKTGVNHELGKNMIGTFYQPSLVWIDVATLKTLPEREVRAGIAEIIKYGVIRDADLFRYLMKNRKGIHGLDPDMLLYVIKRSCEIKADVVSADERESGVRAILNFGHTIGHALETLTEYTTYLHGEAVSIGMCYEAELSRIQGLTNDETVNEICTIVHEFGLPTRMPDDIDHDAFINAMELDKKAIGGKLRFILPETTGSVRIETDVDKDRLIETLKFRP